MIENRKLESQSSQDEITAGQSFGFDTVDMPPDPDAGLNEAEKKAIVSS
jgi:hypothetical protein